MNGFRTITAVLVCAGFAAVISSNALAQRNRQMPPEQVQCDRNQLTSYTGVITETEIDGEQLLITIETDWDTVETVEIAIGEDLQTGERITAWVCSDCEIPPYIQRLER